MIDIHEDHETIAGNGSSPLLTRPTTNDELILIPKYDYARRMVCTGWQIMQRFV